MAIIGGSGFIGRHLVAAAAGKGRRVRTLTRRVEHGVEISADVSAVHGSLDDEASLRRLVTPGCTVVNLAWSGTTPHERALEQARSLAKACLAGGARRLLHCSTVAVLGGHRAARRIDDGTPPLPADDYGRAKLAVDELLARELGGRMPLTLIRPSAVFGPGGLSLMKLATSLTEGSRAMNYAWSCVLGDRLLHLVPVESVVHAMLLLDARAGEGTSCYIVAADEDPLSRFRPVERLLMRALGVRDYRVPPVRLPRPVVRTAFDVTGRAHGLPFTSIESPALTALGFRHPVTMATAVEAFAAWFKTR
jgi:nucleoside-diphosphate-sugar epimerase